MLRSSGHPDENRDLLQRAGVPPEVRGVAASWDPPKDWIPIFIGMTEAGATRFHATCFMDDGPC
jgi:hypothetical protein